MKSVVRLGLGLLVAMGLLGGAYAQEPGDQRVFTLAYQWDMDGEAADNDQIVTSVALTDTAAFTIAAQPDTCRLVDITVTDADSSITAGALTVTGSDCLGYPKSCSFTFAAGGSGVKTLTCTDGKGAYLAAVTAAGTGALTGEGAGDAVTVGYTGNSPESIAMYGRLSLEGPSGEHGVDLTGAFEVPLRITTSGSLSTTVTSVDSNAAFAQVAAGDLLLFNVGGKMYERKVTARASADSITVNKAVNIPAVGVGFRFRRLYVSSDPNDQLFIPVQGWRTITFGYDVAANANTGGVVLNFGCTPGGPGFPESAVWYTPDYATPLPVTVASGSTGYATYVLELEHAPYSHCRVNWKFGTGDDADAAAENLSYWITLGR